MKTKFQSHTCPFYRSVCRISQWVMQEVRALVSPVLTHDLLWTLTPGKQRDKPCRHLGCHDKHKPGSCGEIIADPEAPLAEVHGAGLSFRVISTSSRLHTASESCAQQIRGERAQPQIKERWDECQTHHDQSYSRTERRKEISAWNQFQNSFHHCWIYYFYKPDMVIERFLRFGY